MFKKTMATVLFFVFCAFFSSSAFAQADATGVEIKAAITAPIYLYNNGITSDKTYYGVGVNLALGYRWQYFGLYIDQDFRSVFVKKSEDKYKGHFMGAFHVMGRTVLAINTDFLIYGGFGLGFMYGTHDNRKDLGLNKNDIAFSLKAQLGFSYFLTERFSIGLDFSYAYGFAKTK